ncbi:Kinetochore protein Ndc80 [Dillenia turbinata]|uniref:Kinetochore protein NDC80 n=1 Tax=Dillenia turbinata TaxID=194707 RepID=A0AAN8YWS0_9MAGN
MKGTGKRRQTTTEQYPHERHAPPPPPPALPQNPRDSDASFCSSRPSSSSIGTARIAIADRSYQLSALHLVNSYLSSYSSTIFLKTHLPSAKDINDTIKFLLCRLDFQPSSKIDEDLQIIMKQLNCPIKINKSALRAPGAPHAWPSVLALIHWLVQLAMYNDGLHSSNREEENSMLTYAHESYIHYIRGDDDKVEEVDNDFIGKLEREREIEEEIVRVLEKEERNLKERIEALKAEPNPREVIEKEKGVLEEDVKKFNTLIEGLLDGIATLEKGLVEKERELETKEMEHKKISEENAELKRTVELQVFNARDVERMKRELQAVEREIEEAETGRNAYEEKCWDVKAALGHKLQELEALAMECNQALRRLKLGSNLQYKVNAEGSTPAEVLGIDYKSTLKPALESFAEDIEKSSKEKLEESIALQQQLADVKNKNEGKKRCIDALESHINKSQRLKNENKIKQKKVEAELDFLKKEAHEYISRCAAEARKMAEDVEAETQNIDMMEKEAAEVVKASKLKLQEAILKNEEGIQICAHEFFALVDLVSKYKEYMASKICEMKSNLSETVSMVSDIYKGSLPVQFGNISDADQDEKGKRLEKTY